jgi:hypothetical protein
MSNFQKTVRIMENPTLPTNWLAALSNANHDGTTQQIDDAVGNFETENQVFLQKAQAVHQARVQEDDVWQKSFTLHSPTSLN